MPYSSLYSQAQQKIMRVAMGHQGLADESAGKAIGEKWFHYTLDNREASTRQLPLFTLLNMLSGPLGL